LRRPWATEWKHLPVKDVASRDGWKDVTTLINGCQQPDDDTLRMLVEYRRPGVTSGHRMGGLKANVRLTH
jgi:hypothetical protein